MLDPDKKERILAAAGRAFSRLGFRKASIDQIARAAGVAKGTVYLACENKEELFYQTLHRDLRAWLATVAKQIAEPKRLAVHCGLRQRPPSGTSAPSARRYCTDRVL